MPLVYYILQEPVAEAEAQRRVQDARAKKNKDGEADALLRLARAQADTGSLAEALESVTTALTLYREVNSKKGEAGAMHMLSVVQHARGLADQAHYAAREAVKSAQAARDEQLEAAALHAIAEVRILSQDHKEALAAANDALARARNSASKRGEVLILCVLVQAHLGLNQREKATEVARDAATLCQEVQELGAQSKALDSVTSAFQATKSLETAVDIMQKAKDHYRNLGNTAIESLVLCKLAKVYNLQSEHSTAVMLGKQAVTLSQDSKASLAAAHAALADAYLGNEDFDEALRESQASAALFRELEDKISEVAALETAVNTCLQKMDADEGLRIATQAAERFQAAGQRAAEAAVLLAAAEVTLQMQDVEGALVYYKKARSTYNQIKELRGEAMAFHKIAQLAAAVGDIEEALWSTQRALALYRKIKDKSGEAGVLLVSADMSFAKAWGCIAQDHSAKAQQETREALRNAQLAAGLLRSAGDRQGEATALLSVGNAQLMLKDAAAALKATTECTAICEDVGIDAARAGSLLISAGAHLADGRLDLAQQSASEARSLFRQRGDGLGEDATASFLKDVSDVESGAYKKERFQGFYLRGTDSFQPLPAEAAAKTARREEKKPGARDSRMNTNQSQVQIFSPTYEIFANFDGFETRAAAGSQQQSKLRRASEAKEADEEEEARSREMAGLPGDAGPRYRAEVPPVYAVRWQGIPSQPGKPKPEGHVARIQAGAEGTLAGIIDAGPLGAGTYFPPMFRVAPS